MRQALAVPILTLMYGLAYLDRQVLTLLVDPIRADLGINDLQVSILQGGAFVLFFVVCGIPIGWAVDRFSRRNIIFAGVLLWSLASAAGGRATSYLQLLVTRFGVGAAEATLAPGAYSLLGDLVPKNRLAGAMALFSIGAVIGGAVSMALGGYVTHRAMLYGDVSLPLIGLVRPWQLVLLMVGLAGIPLSFLVLLIPEPARKAESASETAPSWATVWSHLKRYRRFYGCHITGFSMFNLMAASYVAWAPTILIRKWDMSISEVGMIIAALTVVFGISGMMFSGHFVDWLYRKGRRDAHFLYYVIAVPIMGLAGAAVGFGPSLPVTIVGMAVIQFIISFIAVAAAALQLPTPPRLRGRFSAIFLFIFNVVGYAIGPTLVAVAAKGVGGDIAGGLGLVMLCAAPLVAAIFALGRKSMVQAVAEQSD